MDKFLTLSVVDSAWTLDFLELIVVIFKLIGSPKVSSLVLAFDDFRGCLFIITNFNEWLNNGSMKPDAGPYGSSYGAEREFKHTSNLFPSIGSLDQPNHPTVSPHPKVPIPYL